MVPAFLSSHDRGSVLRVRVVVRAGRTEVAGERMGALLVRLAAAPVEGAANEALLTYLASRLHVARHSIRLMAGARGRDKRVLVSGLQADEVARRLSGGTG